MKTPEQKRAAKLRKLRKAMNAVIKKREPVVKCERCMKNKADHRAEDKLLCTNCYSAWCDHVYEEVREKQ